MAGHRVRGRSKEIAEARLLLRADGALTISGPVGIGKSTLLAELAETALHDGWLVVAARGRAPHRPHGLLLDLAQAAVRTAPRTGRHLDRLRSVLLPARRPEEHHASVAARPLAALLDSAQTPVLLVVDDTDRADAPSLEALALLPTAPGSRFPRSLLTAGRAPAPALAGHPHLPLGPLTADRLRALVGERLGPGLPDEDLRDAVEASGGSPHLALEAARDLHHVRTSGAPHHRVPLSDRRVPESARTALTAVLAPVGDAVRDLLLHLACANGQATVETVRLLRGPAADRDLDAVRRFDLVREAPTGGLTVHPPLLGRFLQDEAGPAGRRLVHARWAAALAAADPHLTPALVRHRLLAAGPLSAAADELTRQAEEAVHHLAADGRPDPAVDLALTAAGRTARARTAHGLRLVAAEHALSANRPVLAARLARVAATASTDREHRERAWVVALDAAGRHTADEYDRTAHAAGRALADSDQVRARLALWAWRRGRPGQAMADATAPHRAPATVQLRMELAGHTCPPGGPEACLADPAAEQPAASAAAGGGVAAVGAGQAVGSVGASGGTVTAIRRIADGAELRSAWAHLHHYRLERAWELFEAVRWDAERAGQADALGAALSGQVQCAIRTGHAARATAAADRLVDLSGTEGFDALRARLVLAFAELHVGDTARALELARDVGQCAAAGGFVGVHAHALHTVGAAHLDLGRPYEALPALQAAEHLISTAGYPLVGGLDLPWRTADALTATRRPDEAAAHIDGVRRRARAEEPPYALPAQLDRSEAVLRARSGDTAAAEELLDGAEEFFARHGLRLDQARTAVTRAAVLRRARRAAAARPHLTRARQILFTCGPTPLDALADREAARLGETSTPVLTDADAELLHLVTAGRSNAELAKALCLSVKTVEARLSRLYRLLGVKGRRELIARGPHEASGGR